VRNSSSPTQQAGNASRKSEIVERKETETSLMPPIFGETIPPAELSDLLAFLRQASAK